MESRWYKQGAALLEEIEGSRPGPGEAWLWYLGQHGFVINLGDRVFYIDTILNDLKNPEGKSLREYPPPFAPGMVRRVDYALCTHNHGDHLNLETLIPLARANPKARLVVPRPWTALLRDAGIDEGQILGAAEGEELNLGPVSILPTAAIHTRYVQDKPERGETGEAPCLGYILKTGDLRIYHAGDTWVSPPLVQSLKAAGPLNIALLPINGTDWERTAAGFIGNMGPLDAVKLAQAIPADLCIPAHYDMMAANSENPALFAAYMYRHCPEKRFHICALGERFIYRN
ncbi:MAG: MBL fold metallo-hydrolase [Treponema sp.]|jgi:L-ascorbate metabolism protein UlaG (beta-lactamase superfamily)|nr:MBL fold metallo-hydrolase [Treponema sp.]